MSTPATPFRPQVKVSAILRSSKSPAKIPSGRASTGGVMAAAVRQEGEPHDHRTDGPVGSLDGAGGGGIEAGAAGEASEGMADFVGARRLTAAGSGRSGVLSVSALRGMGPVAAWVDELSARATATTVNGDGPGDAPCRPGSSHAACIVPGAGRVRMGSACACPSSSHAGSVGRHDGGMFPVEDGVAAAAVARKTASDLAGPDKTVSSTETRLDAESRLPPRPELPVAAPHSPTRPAAARAPRSRFRRRVKAKGGAGGKAKSNGRRTRQLKGGAAKRNRKPKLCNRSGAARAGTPSVTRTAGGKVSLATLKLGNSRVEALPALASARSDTHLWEVLSDFSSTASSCSVDSNLSIDDTASDTDSDELLAAELTCEHYGVLDNSSGQPVIGVGVHEKVQIASVTKVMTAICVLRAVDCGIVSLRDRVPVSRRAATTGGTTASLQAGDVARLEDLLYGMMLPSGNDAATAMAEHVGQALDPAVMNDLSKRQQKQLEKVGSGEHYVGSFHRFDPWLRFVGFMNATAADLGLARTAFANPHGLQHDAHHSCVADVLRMARVALADPRIETYGSTGSYTCEISSLVGGTSSRRELTWENTNQLLGDRGGLRFSGLKTGITPAAGGCLVTRVVALEEDDMGAVPAGCEYLVATLGSQNAAARFKDNELLARHAASRGGLVPTPF